jgi:two-component system sensor histidine kinase KdpD
VTGSTSPQGRLKVFLGYAAGVGKTFQLLQEGRELKDRGVDVAIAYFEPHERQDTIALAGGLETIPRRTVDYKGQGLEEMDADAVIRRRPRVAVVDELAHTNVPGSKRAKRYEDVLALLGAGIDVLTTMNVQHLESLNDQIWQSTGVRVLETLPDWVLKEADEVVLVDLTPRALLNRLARGAVYPPGRVPAAFDNFFKESTLVALRELAMRQTAHAVESHLPEETAPPETPDAAAPERERVLLVLSPDPSSAALIRRGRRVADYLRAECLAVHVREPAVATLRGERGESLDRHLAFARGLRIDTRTIKGSDVAHEVVEFARAHGVTQIFVTRDKPSAMHSRFASAFVQRLVTLARDMEVTVVADRSVRRE